MHIHAHTHAASSTGVSTLAFPQQPQRGWICHAPSGSVVRLFRATLSSRSLPRVQISSGKSANELLEMFCKTETNKEEQEREEGVHTQTRRLVSERTRASLTKAAQKLQPERSLTSSLRVSRNSETFAGSCASLLPLMSRISSGRSHTSAGNDDSWFRLQVSSKMMMVMVMMRGDER